MSTAKNAILKAKIEGVIQDLMVKTDAYNVYVDDNTTLAAKLTSIIADIATKASTESVNSAIDALRQEMLGDTPVEAYNTFTELAQYIEAHKEVSDALSAAIGTKADKATTLAGYGITDAYTQTETDQKIADALDDNVFAIPFTGNFYDNTLNTDASPVDVTAAYNAGKQIVLSLNNGAQLVYPDSVELSKERMGPDITITGSYYLSVDSTYYRFYLYGAQGSTNFTTVSVETVKETSLKINDSYYTPYTTDGKIRDFTDAINTMIDAKISSAAKIYYSATEPSDLTEQDLWVQYV